jgi:hypothetical protein
MSLAPLIEFSLETTSQQSAQLAFIVNAAAAVGGTSLVFALATNDPIGAAMKPAAQSRVIGGRLSIDKGDGVLTAVKGSELGDSIQITGTLNDFGGRTLTFSRFGKDFSPFISSALRELRAVSFSIVRGVRGNTATKKLFDGHFRSTTFQPYPPIAAITCQDASLKFAQTPFFYTLAPGSGRTRLDILLDIFAQYGIPYGRLDFPNNTGGKVSKPINEGGSRSVLDFLNEFIAPIGCRANWKDNQINIRRPGMHIGAGKPGNGSVIKFWTPDVPVRTLNPSNIRSLSVQPPNTDAPNAIRFTALTFGYIGATGEYSVVKDVLSNGVYAPLVAVNKQDRTTGAITATGLSSSSASRPVHRIVTRINYDGGTVVSQTIEEYAWFAPKIQRNQQTGSITLSSLTSVGTAATATTPSAHTLKTGDFVVITNSGIDAYNGTYQITVTGANTFTYVFAGGASPATGSPNYNGITHNHVSDCWQFADGTWRATAQEDFQVIKRTVIVGTFDANGYRTQDTASVYQFFGKEQPYAFILGGESLVRYSACFLDDSGISWVAGKEQLTLETNTTSYQFDSSTFARTRDVEAIVSTQTDNFSTVAYSRTSLFNGAATSLSYVFGPRSAPSYWVQASASQATAITTYAPVDEATYRRTVAVNTFGVYPPSFQSLPSASNFILSGTVPTAEQKTSQQKAQPTSILLRDKVRQVFNNGKEVLVMYQNDWCETEGELITCALELMRDIASPRVSIDMDFDAMCEEGVTVAVNYPGTTLRAENMIVFDWNATLNMSNGQNSQTLGCRWDPPELRAGNSTS